MAESAGVFLTDPDKSHQTKERQVVEVRAGRRVGPVCCTPLLGDCDFNEIRCGGERQRRRAARWSGTYTEVLCGWVARLEVGGVAEEGWQGTLAHWVHSACVLCSPHKSSLADPEGISRQCLRTDLRGRD